MISAVGHHSFHPPFNAVAAVTSSIIQRVSSASLYVFAFCAIWLTFKTFEAQFIQALQDKNTPKFNLLASIVNLWNKNMVKEAESLISTEGDDKFVDIENDDNEVFEMNLDEIYALSHPDTVDTTDDEELSDVESDWSRCSLDSEELGSTEID